LFRNKEELQGLLFTVQIIKYLQGESMSKKRRRIGFGTAVVVAILLVSWYMISDLEKTSLTEEVRSGAPGQFIELSNGYVHYELKGPDDAPTIVLVHGFSVPYYVWDPTFEALVQEGFQVLRYDLYGRGYSDRPDADYNLELFSEQLEQLLTALGIDEPVSLVGLSFGGPVIARFANQNSGWIRSLCLIDPQIATVSTGEIFPMNIPLVGEYLMAVYVTPEVLPKSQVEDFFRPELFSGWEGAYQDQLQYKGFRRAILSTMRNMVGVNNLKEYDDLWSHGFPIALFWGQQDRTISAEDIEQLRLILPDLIFHPIAEAGHLPHYEKPDYVNPLLIEFLLEE
jgi:pimeloyl-ACP methyl ester carboxylesterase